MISVTFCGETYECVKAIKGVNYVHLLDNYGEMVASFTGITDFSGFTITGGDWIAAETPDDCSILVSGTDGVPRKSGIKCSDVYKKVDVVDKAKNYETGGNIEGALNAVSASLVNVNKALSAHIQDYSTLNNKVTNLQNVMSSHIQAFNALVTEVSKIKNRHTYVTIKIRYGTSYFYSYVTLCLPYSTDISSIVELIFALNNKCGFGVASDTDNSIMFPASGSIRIAKSSGTIDDPVSGITVDNSETKVYIHCASTTVQLTADSEITITSKTVEI